MTFARIEMLFLIWAAPVLALIVAYGMRRRRKALSRFASPNGLAVIAPTSSARRRWVKGGLLIAGLAFLSLSLSGPRYDFRWQEIERRGVDILIALDCSRSMLARDLQPTRLDRAKREVLDLIAMLQGDRVGLAAFSGTAFLQCPLTLDYAAFHLFLEVLSPDYLPVGGTDITGALTVARNGFDPKSAAEKAVILITDGENTGRGDPVAAARKLDEAGITLFCIGVGGEEGVPVPAADGGFKKDREGQIVMTRLDEDLLQRMALLTGGTYVRSVAGDMDLDVVYRQEIRGKMEAAALAGRSEERFSRNAETDTRYGRTGINGSWPSPFSAWSSICSCGRSGGRPALRWGASCASCVSWRGHCPLLQPSPDLCRRASKPMTGGNTKPPSNASSTPSSTRRTAPTSSTTSATPTTNWGTTKPR